MGAREASVINDNNFGPADAAQLSARLVGQR